MTAGRLLVFSGAGLSAESGIPTFRDSDGTWEKHDVNKIANIETFDQNRDLVFRFYNDRRRDLATREPNAAHVTLAELQKELGTDRVVIVTQNIDDLLEKAGCLNVIHVHGFGLDMSCRNCGHVWNVGYAEVQPTDPCPSCRMAATKPGVVFFGEPAPRYGDMITLFASATKDDVVLVIGTNGVVVDQKWITGLEHDRESGVKVLITKDPGWLDTEVFDSVITEPVGEVLPAIKHVLINLLNGKKP